MEVRQPLAFKFVSFTTIIIIIIAVFFSWYLIRKERILLEDELVKRGKVVTKAIATNCQYGVYTENYEILNNFIASAILEKDVVYAFIANKDGLILAHSNPTKIGSTFNFKRGVGEVKVKKTPWQNQTIYDISMLVRLDRGKLSSPTADFSIQNLLERGIRVKDELLGFVNVGISNNNLEASFENMKKNIFIFTTVIVAIGIMLGIMFANKISSPIKELSQAATSIAHGDLNQRVSYTSNDEIGDLAMVFNKMGEDLKASREEIEKYSKNLEKMVKDRTIQLETANKELNHTKELYRQLSIKDGLTGIYNHRYFEEILSKEFARVKRYARPISLLMIDLDHFKKFNDTYGHPTGDYILKQLSALLSKFVRSVDFVARYGGEEFSIILFETEKQDAIKSADRLVRLVRQKKFPPIEGLPELSITISVGVANYPQDAKTRETLVKKADDALYQAKTTGRDKFYFFEEKEIL